MKKRKELSVEQLQSLVMNGRLKKFVSIEEGALLYSVGKNTFREMATENPTRRTWSGHAFEQVCMDHISQIKYKLQIGGVLSKEYAWSISAVEEKGITGAQIDLLIDRRDHVVSICEMKYSVNKFGIDKGYDEDLRNKIDSFVNATDCKKTVQLVMVTTYGLKPSKYNSLVNAEVELDDLFYPV